ncbi:MAG: hypothetical protein WCJ49_00950 [Deltaproteobacteria bacterium]
MNKKNVSVSAQPVKPVNQQLTPEIVCQLIENQAQELELRAQELALQRQQDDHSFEFSKKAIEAQVTDRNLQRELNKHLQRNQYFLISFLAFATVIVITYSLYLDKEAFATEIIKAIFFFFAGGVGGYGLRNKNDADHKNADKKE